MQVNRDHQAKEDAQDDEDGEDANVPKGNSPS